MILTACSILFLALWNTVWAILSDIHQFETPFGGTQNKMFTEDDLGLFDTIMFRGESALTFMVYQLIIIAGPLDISRMHDLQKNQRTYAILFCMMGAIKLTIQGLIFDNYLNHILDLNFYYI